MTTKTKLGLSKLALSASLLISVFGRTLEFSIFHYLAVLVVGVVSLVCVKEYSADFAEESRIAIEAKIQSGDETRESIRAKKRRGIFITFGSAFVFSGVLSILLSARLDSPRLRVIFVGVSLVSVVIIAVITLRRVGSEANDNGA